jgi:AAA+ superfamily predicted ATPase
MKFFLFYLILFFQIKFYYPLTEKINFKNINIVFFNSFIIGSFLALTYSSIRTMITENKNNSFMQRFITPAKFCINGVAILQTSLIFYKKHGEETSILKILFESDSNDNPKIKEKINSSDQNPRPLYGVDDLMKKIEDSANTLLQRYFGSNSNQSILKEGHMNLLFEGPSGCGKTKMIDYLHFILKKKIDETYNKIIQEEQNKYITKPNIMIYEISKLNFCNKYYGEEAKSINNFFENIIKLAQNNPTTLFLIQADECDSMFGERLNNNNNVYAEALNTFLLCLDRMKLLNIIVVGTTNRKDSIDKSILNRFANIYHFPNANKKIREAIISQTIKEYYENKNIEIQLEENDKSTNLLIEATAGLSGRQIISFLTNLFAKKIQIDGSSELFLKENFNKNNKLKKKNIQITNEEIEEERNNFKERIYLNQKDIKEKYKNSFEDIIGYDKQKRILNEHIYKIINKKNIIKENFNKKDNKNLIFDNDTDHLYFYGVPGTGKTELTKSFINEFIRAAQKINKTENINIALFEIDPHELINLENINNLINQANQLAEEGFFVFCICNEINGIINNNNPDSLLRSTLINLLDKNVIIIGTANSKINDEAINRRFTSIQFKELNYNDQTKMFNYYNKLYKESLEITFTNFKKLQEKYPDYYNTGASIKKLLYSLFNKYKFKLHQERKEKEQIKEINIEEFLEEFDKI